MQKRHTDTRLYFQELERTTEKYLVPEIEKIVPIIPGMKVAEVGCSVGGNLAPFLKRGCRVYGIDIDPLRIKEAQNIFKSKEGVEKVHLFPCDILDLEETDELKFDVIILRDMIEHMTDKNHLLQKLKKHLSPSGIIYFAFPPWRMPFGGHHQICRTFLSKLPWFHLLPSFFYFGIMKMMLENDKTILILREIHATRISIRQFRNLLSQNNYSQISETTYLINPHYEAKFNLKPRVLPKIFNIIWLSDFYSTAHSSFVKPK